uniref:Uncharacterized protein LOC104243404 n=1 Tax=Nicotiana sylvestris TaxID=4096 RepID=A0A1U7Y4K0_NICSY|nr:PREDICTED: uncharacterized protein LOC104243404 [Nicotiana sylvestris]
MKDLGELKYFLGIEFVRSADGILMHQRKYVLEIISELGLGATKPVDTPLEVNAKLTAKEYDNYLGTLNDVVDELLPDPSAARWCLGSLRSRQRYSAEAEYGSLAAIVAELVWLVWLIKEIGVEVQLLMNIYCDSKGAIQTAANPVFHERSKHIDIDCHFIREKILEGLVSTMYVGTREQ